jgi:hypothetical protein
VMVDYTTPSKRPRSAVGGHARRCAVCVGQELQLGPFGARSREHDNDCCIGPGQVSESSQQSEATQSSSSLFQYCPSKVWAFSLAHRSWREVRVGDLHEVFYPDTTGTKLYIRSEEQELFEALVKTHISSTEATPSHGPRKPRGCNVLLQGAPGSGKTFILGRETPPPLRC